MKGVIEGIPSTIDPCVFVDDDGQPYIYTSGAGQGCWGGKLRKDAWTTLDGTMTPLKGFTDFHEAPWMHKYKGKYYLSHSDNHASTQGGNQMQYSVSDNPLGPFTPCGVYMYPQGEETAHGSIVEYNGKWYSFYHTSNHSGRGGLRSVCVDPIEYDLKGNLKVVKNWGRPYGNRAVEIGLNKQTIIQAENYNMGGQHTAYYKNPKTGTRMDVKTENGIGFLSSMKGGEWVRYTFNVSEAGRYGITFRVRQKRNGGKFRVAVNGVYKTNDIVLNGGVNTWIESYVYPVELQEGEQYIDIRIKSGDLDIDWIRFGEGASLIPGIIQAEDYDDGGYSFKQGEFGNFKSYRKDKGVAISASDGVVHISNTSVGDWLQYTFTTQGGAFEIRVRASAERDGIFSLSFDDGKPLSNVAVSTGGWTTYQEFIGAKVNLTPGKHTMKIHIVNPLNLDSFEFR